MRRSLAYASGYLTPGILVARRVSEVALTLPVAAVVSNSSALTILSIIPEGNSTIASLEPGRAMKRISLLILGLCTTAWASGCCCSYYSRANDWDDSCVQNQPRCKGRGRRNRRADRVNGVNRNDGEDGSNGDGCNCCCDSCCGASGAGTGQPALPSSPPTYDSGAMMQGGCATGNCGQMQTYSGTPFDPSAGWTIQSTTSHPVGNNEPVMAPASSPATPITPSQGQSHGWAPSSAPSPGPVPPPVSYNR
jgi:hypothetical protein